MLEKASYRVSKEMGGCQVLGEGGVKSGGRRRLGAMKLLGATLQWRLHGISHLSQPTERTTSRMNSDVNRGLRVPAMCQCRFTCYSRSTAGGGCSQSGMLTVGAQGSGSTTISTQSCCEPKTSRKKSKAC